MVEMGMGHDHACGFAFLFETFYELPGFAFHAGIDQQPGAAGGKQEDIATTQKNAGDRCSVAGLPGFHGRLVVRDKGKEIE